MHGTTATERRWRNLPVVREPDSRRTRWLFLLALGIAFATSPFVFYVLKQIDTVRVRYEIEELRAQHGKLVEAERRLRMERATLEALPRVEERAIRELGLVDASPDQVLVLPSLRQGRGAGGVRAPDAARPAPAR